MRIWIHVIHMADSLHGLQNSILPKGHKEYRPMGHIISSFGAYYYKIETKEFYYAIKIHLISSAL